MHSDITPSALELLDTTVIEMIRKHSSTDLPVAEALILVETDGFDELDVLNQMKQLMRVFNDCGANTVETAETESDALRLWSVRKSIGGLIGAINFDFMSLEHDPVAMRVMRTVKNALDPNNILNPGKMGL